MNLENKTLKNIFFITIFIAIAIFIISQWGSEDADGPPEANREKVQGKGGLFSGIFSESIEDQDKQKDAADSENIDPRLKNISINELPVEEPNPEPTDPEEKKIYRVSSIITEPMSMIMQKYSSFICEGEMKVLAPSLTTNEKAYKQGKKYGPGIEVSGKFTFTKDKHNNFRLHQETRCAKKESKYNTEIYNGDLYYIEGNYYFVDNKGTLRDKDTTESVLAVRQQDRQEPLVRRNWIQIIKDLGGVLGFDEHRANNDNTEEKIFFFKGRKPNLQKKTVLIKKLSGSVMIVTSNDTMIEGSINGRNTYKHGYLSGADSSYTIKMRIHSIGNAPDVREP
ncbi:MAG: hypothetical protein GY754_23215 [bacterium]|nr:hypothetical protein [bacterium]